MKLVATLLGVAVCAVSFAQTAQQREYGKMAAGMFVGKEVPVGYEWVPAYRKKGIATLKPMSKAKLKATLEPVYLAFPRTSLEAMGAAYVMGIYGVNSADNARRILYGIKNRTGDPTQFLQWESAPAAFYDICVRQNSLVAFECLTVMPADGAVAETAEYMWGRCFAEKPLIVRQWVGSDAKRYRDLVESLAYTMADTDKDYYTHLSGPETVMKGINTLKRSNATWGNRLLRDIRAEVKKNG